MADAFLMFGKYYVTEWKVNVVYTSQTNIPYTGQWKDISEEPMTEADLMNVYYETEKHLKNLPRLTIVTGPYQEKLTDFYNVVIDIDDLGPISKEEKKALEEQLAGEGLVTVSSPRGVHLHFRIPRTRKVYAISLVKENEEGKMEKVGEGAALQKHLWTSPPTRRVISADKQFYTYSFVLPNGERFAKYDLKLLEKLKPPLMTLDDVGNIIESLLGYRIVSYSPEKGVAPKDLKIKGEELGIRVKPIFKDMDEFHARIHNYPLPIPAARILYNYYKYAGAPSLANSILAKHPPLMKDNNPISHGMRFLASAEFALFVAHLTSFVKFEEILEVLQYGVEDFPVDEGMPIDRKLRYLFLFDDETGEYVFPRYSGLGSLRPIFFCEECLWKGECDKRGASPWNQIRRLVERIRYGKEVPSQYTNVEI